MRLFVRLAERKSFSAAARDLRVKQSTASKWVAELEADLRVALVERTTRSVQLTEAGRRFLACAEDVLRAIDSVTLELQERSPEVSGRVRLSVPVVFGRLFVVPAIIPFLRAHPKVAVDIVFDDRYVNLVEDGFDLAIRVGVPRDTSARGRKLAVSSRILVASPEYLQEHGKPTCPRDLKDHECIAHRDEHVPTTWRFQRAGDAEIPVTVGGRLVANNSEAVLAMAQAGLGLVLLAEWLVEPDLRRNTLVPLLEDYSTPPAPVYALTTPGRYTPAAVRTLLEHLVISLGARLGGPTTGWTPIEPLPQLANVESMEERVRELEAELERFTRPGRADKDDSNA